MLSYDDGCNLRPLLLGVELAAIRKGPQGKKGVHRLSHLSLDFRFPLPQHVISEFFRIGAHGRQCGKLVVEGFVGMGFFVLFERSPIGHDHIMGRP